MGDDIESCRSTGSDYRAALHWLSGKSKKKRPDDRPKPTSWPIKNPAYLIPLRHLWMSQKVRRCLPQALTRYAIEAALKLMLLSKSKAMKMGFNSLCAYASVNHLHWHLYYLQDGFEG